MARAELKRHGAVSVISVDDVVVSQSLGCVRMRSNEEPKMAPLFVLTLKLGKKRKITLAIWWPFL